MKVYVIDYVDQYVLELCLSITKSLGIVTTIETNRPKIEKDFQTNSEPRLVIFNENVFSKDDAEELYRKINIDNGVPVKIMGRSSGLAEFVLEVELEKNLEIIGNFFRAQNENKKSGKFLPILLYKLLNIDPHNLGCDLYIKMSKNGKDHYVKRLHATDQFNVDEIQAYINKGFKEFYVPEEQYEVLINILTMELIKTYSMQLPENTDLYRVYCTSYEVILERLKLFGVDELTRNLVDLYIKAITISIRNENEFYKFLQNSKQNKNCAAFGISYFCAIISHQLLVHYEWNSDAARDTMLFLSLFHDISLLNPELTKIRSEADLEKLSTEEKKMVLNHADQSAIFVEQFNNVPFGLTQLIREHHGNKDGVGFSQSLSLNVSPMVMTFIVIEEFGLMLMDYVNKNPATNDKELKRQIKNIMNKLEQSFSKLTYQKTVQVLRELLDKLNVI